MELAPRTDVLLYLCLIIFASSAEPDINYYIQAFGESFYLQKNISTPRGPRSWPWILPFYRRTIIKRGPCTSSNLEGNCMSRLQCESISGTPSGRCSGGKGVCCTSIITCGQSTNARITYFRNPEFPSPNTGSGMCQVTINKTADDICQLKFTFLQLNLAQPDNMGECNDDFLSFGSPTTPKICGDNNGKTVYVDFDPTCAFQQIILDTRNTISMQRFWDIEIKQIPCTSTELAPPGCLMYFTSTSGSVTSFNFDDRTTAAADSNRQLTNLNYGVCIKPASGYCEMEWSASTDSIYSFTVSGDSMSLPGEALRGADCNHNYVVIPAPSYAGMDLGTDRFCGSSFTTIRTKSQPYVLTIKTMIEDTDVGNRGFKLDFRQILCP